MALCARLGLPSVDATPALLQAGPAKSLFQQDHIHLSVAGNAAVAAAAAAGLRALLK